MSELGVSAPFFFNLYQDNPMSISKYLLNHHGIYVTPGAKTRCHVCQGRKKTLSVRRDDTLAKCFRCGIYLVGSANLHIFDSSTGKREAIS